MLQSGNSRCGKAREDQDPSMDGCDNPTINASQGESVHTLCLVTGKGSGSDMQIF